MELVFSELVKYNNPYDEEWILILKIARQLGLNPLRLFTIAIYQFVMNHKDLISDQLIEQFEKMYRLKRYDTEYNPDQRMLVNSREFTRRMGRTALVKAMKEVKEEFAEELFLALTKGRGKKLTAEEVLAVMDAASIFSGGGVPSNVDLLYEFVKVVAEKSRKEADGKLGSVDNEE